jgi:hypothetical protein
VPAASEFESKFKSPFTKKAEKNEINLKVIQKRAQNEKNNKNMLCAYTNKRLKREKLQRKHKRETLATSPCKF